MKYLRFILLLFSVITAPPGIAAGCGICEIRVAPVSQTVEEGKVAEFYCKTFATTHDWFIDGHKLVLRNGSLHRERGIRRCLARQLVGSEFDTKLCVDAIPINNNTSIRCGFYDEVSQPVFLLIEPCNNCTDSPPVIQFNIEDVEGIECDK